MARERKAGVEEADAMLERRGGSIWNAREERGNFLLLSSILSASSSLAFL
ncbi:MAG: hypothetical protein O7C59_03715 [Rickettsia endosymbiont of Ixodes persulcatus]|nr:hypothetical protein [Rickettsia endosymbiont of Ixodes persulcatus]